MQKFNETKESSEENADKTAQPPQTKISTAEKSEGDVKSSADSRQSPVGESHREEPSAATPDAQDNQENSTLRNYGLLKKLYTLHSCHRQECTFLSSTYFLSFHFETYSSFSACLGFSSSSQELELRITKL